MQEMVIYGVSFDMVGKQPIVLLKAVDTNKFLPIWIGHPEPTKVFHRGDKRETPPSGKRPGAGFITPILARPAH